ncbi:MAG: hypothetical protein JWM11_2723 [Planctomycetaceae bacterium]|nr:hypothetical protein [Planctomycetaceae bacterium]
MTSQSYSDLSRNELLVMAQERGIAGWKGMKKDDLVQALGAVKKKSADATKATEKGPAGSEKNVDLKPPKVVVAKQDVSNLAASHADDDASLTVNTGKAAKTARSSSAPKRPKTAARPARSSTLTAKSRGQRPSTLTPSAEAMVKRDLAQATNGEKVGQDRFVLLVRDPHWLQAVWEFSRGTIQRAEAALGADWHRAVPILRVLDVSGHDATSRSESRLLDIVIHGGVNFWYVPIDGVSRSYRLQIGYLTASGRFQILARSNVVTPPRPGTPGTISGGWDDLKGEYQRVFALSGGYSESSMHSPVRDLLEERLGRPIDSWDGQLSLNESDSNAPKPGGHLPLTLHAELIIHGITLPDARVSVVEEPARLKPDGSFQVRLALEDGRHLIRTVASRADGSAERTVILSIERNTKELEPHSWEGGC